MFKRFSDHNETCYRVLREVVFYWRSMEANAASVHIPLSVIASVPGAYTGPASRTYLYYTGEHKKWVDGVRVEITPK